MLRTSFLTLALIAGLTYGQLSPHPPSWFIADSPSQHCETQTGTHTITVTNPTEINLQVRTCNKYNPVSGAPCVGNPNKPNHYVDCPNTISAGSSSSISFNADTQYIAFTDAQTQKELGELWPSASGVWPKSYKAAFIEDLLIAESTVMKHTLSEAAHCEDVVADTKTSWWKNKGYMYASWQAGKCPIKFNFVNEVDHPGPRVTHRRLGIVAHPQDVNNICDPTGYVHSVGTDGDDKGKCLELKFGGGKTQSKFWWSYGWKYSPPIGKDWSDGQCDKTGFPTVASVSKDYLGWTDEKNSGYGCGDVVLTKYNPTKPKVEVVPLQVF